MFAASLSDLAPDAQTHVASYLDARDCLSFCSVDRDVRENVFASFVRETGVLSRRSERDGSTWLMRACQGHCADLAFVRFAVRVGGWPVSSVRNDCGETAVHVAVRADDPDVVRALCRPPPSNKRDGDGDEEHEHEHDEEGRRRLVLLANDLGNTALHEAVSVDDDEVVRILCDVGGRRLVEHRNNAGSTALHRAVENGNAEIVRTLLDVVGRETTHDWTDDDGETPASLARRSFDAEIMMMFEDHVDDND